MLRQIALISEHASPLATLGGVDSGGQNVYVAHLGRQLAQLGYRVDIFTRRDHAALEEIVNLSEGLRVVHVAAGPPQFVAKEDMLPWMDQFTTSIIQFIVQHGSYDVVHANFFMSGLVAMRLKRVLGLPFAITFHALGRKRRLYQSGADRFPDERLLIESQIMAEADAVIAECPEDKNDQITLYGVDRRRIRMVPCGFDPGELWPIDRSVARERLGLDAEEPLIVHVGRLVPRKGVDTAIEGFARLVQHHGLCARMLVVGGDSDKPDPVVTPEIGRLVNVAARAGVADRVVFTGRRGRNVLRYYYSAGDVFVTTPWYEPFGITPVESMACGTPVIGSKVGGIRYTIRHGETGYLVPPKDPAATARRMAMILSKPGLRDQMGAAAVIRVNQLFTWDKVGEQVAAILEEIAPKERSTLVAGETFPSPSYAEVSSQGNNGSSQGNNGFNGHRRKNGTKRSPAIFLDKDGTLVENVPYNVDCSKLSFAAGAAEAARSLAESGYKIVVVTNQSGVAHGYFDRRAVHRVRRKLREMLATENVPFAGFYYCPHHPAGVVAEFAVACDCRKPRPGMITRAAEELQIDLTQSWLIGDTLDDVEAAHRAGCRAILVANGGETAWELSPLRSPDVIVANLTSAARQILSRLHGAEIVGPTSLEAAR